MRPERIRLALLALTAACALAGGARATTCTISTTPVSFGSYDPHAGSPNDASGFIDVYCTCTGAECAVDVDYQIEIDAGGSGSTSDRRLLPAGGGGTTLGYGLYQDSNRSVPWGIGIRARSETYPTNLFGSFQRSTVYGRIPAGQHVPADTYSEAPTVTIIY